MVLEWYVTGLLLLNGLWDWKKKEICVWSILLSIPVGIGLNLLKGFRSPGEMLWGVGTGAVIILLSLLTKGAVGFGDGLLLCVTGMLLGPAENLELMTLGALLCAAVLGTGLLFGKTGWKERFPFVPFLLLAQLIRLVIR